ncbi:MAG: type II toxin-antitoxin system RelE/ParE family toxin [Thermodesulfobacteriota bacterium]
MSDNKIEILEYITSDGKNPFHHWLRSLKDQVARARIRVRLNRVRLGNFGDCKSVGGGINELRVDVGPGYRVYFGRDGMQIVILLCGGAKKSQSKDIKLAQEYWTDYQRRKK